MPRKDQAEFPIKQTSRTESQLAWFDGLMIAPIAEVIRWLNLSFAGIKAEGTVLVLVYCMTHVGVNIAWEDEGCITVQELSMDLMFVWLTIFSICLIVRHHTVMLN